MNSSGKIFMRSAEHRITITWDLIGFTRNDVVMILMKDENVRNAPPTVPGMKLTGGS